MVVQTLYIFLHWLLRSTKWNYFFVSVFLAEGYVSDMVLQGGNKHQQTQTHPHKSICRKNELSEDSVLWKYTCTEICALL